MISKDFDISWYIIAYPIVLIRPPLMGSGPPPNRVKAQPVFLDNSEKKLDRTSGKASMALKHAKH